jgi:eukaryotic-like serine/threonine-protein kinase
MSKEKKHFYEFGSYRVDPEQRILLHENRPVQLQPKAFETLLVLIQNSQKVVLKDELMKSLWPDSFVEESNLSQNIFVLRKALGETGGTNRYIITVPGRGYRFAERVELIPEDEASLVVESHSRTRVVIHEHTLPDVNPAGLPGKTTNRGVRRTLVFGTTVALAGLISILFFYVRSRQHHGGGDDIPSSSAAPSLRSRRSVAVLGFRNLSGRPEEGWLSTALAEMLSTELEAGEKLRLVSGEDIARTKLDLPLADADSLSRETLARLHKDMNSDLIVLGSYTALGEKPGTRIRLDLRLQDTAAGETIADVAVVGSEADLFDLVSQAGSRLREKLGVEAVSPVEEVSVRASLPSNRDAARLYSEGLARLRVFDAMEARDLLQQAIEADPKFSLAHSALAEAWSRLGYDKKAQQEARQAYELAANLSREEKLLAEGRYRDIGHENDKAIEVYRTLFTLFPDNLDYGLKLAAMQVRGSKGSDALATVESLRKLAPPASEDPRVDLQEAAAWDALSDLKHVQPPLARAAEKARAQGSRLILADAQNRQCRMFSYLGQMQNAVAACRESRDTCASAGDHQGEAIALRTWADAITETDAPESIRLYQQALTIFRKNGSEAGVAAVLNNLGLVYEAQGDLATAEKMHRQALASFRLLDDKSRTGAATLNIANERMEQGDLRSALQLYEEALHLWEPDNSGGAALAAYNIALIHELQGDLAAAKQGFEQSLGTWQKIGDQDSSAYAMWSLGSLLLEEEDFSAARKMYEQALAIRHTAGDKLSIAETQLGLADLSLEEKHPPVEQEAAIRQTLDVFQKQKARDDETLAWCLLARAMLAQQKAAAAADAMQHARSLAAKSQNPEIRWRTSIAAAVIESFQKDVAHSAAGMATRQELATIIAKSRDLGYEGIELDARLILAEIEMNAGQIMAGQAHLTAIEADARAKGYNLIARKAATARG